MGNNLPWQKMHDVLLHCGSIRDPITYCKTVLNQIDKVIPYDQGRLYFVSENGRIVDEYLICVDQRWSRDYRDYYSKVENGRYAIKSRRRLNVEDSVHNWSEKDSDEFLVDHLRPQNLKHSFGLGLHDMNNNVRGAIALDRTCNAKYSRQEIDIMRYMSPHLNNLHQLFYVTVPEKNDGGALSPSLGLTARESEIAELLCRGVTPRQVGEKLCISITTVRKHIANMHLKLNVNSQQELIVKLLQGS